MKAGLVRHFGANPLFLQDDAEQSPVTSQEWRALIHPDDQAAVDASIAPCLQGEKDDWFCELRLQTKSGDWRWMMIGARVSERDSDGRALRVLGTTQDVHARKSAEDQARRDAELFSKLHDSVVCTDLDGIVTSWNEGAQRLYGWTAQEMLGRSLFERFAEEVRERVRVLHRAIVAGEDFNSEWLDTRKDGSQVWVETRIARFMDAAGRPVGVLGIARDISARRDAEQTTRRDAHILAQLQDVVVCTDAESRVVYWNQAAERVFGWKSEELLGQPLASRFPLHMREPLAATLKEIFSRDRTPPAEWEDCRKDGSRVWIHWRAHRLI